MVVPTSTPALSEGQLVAVMVVVLTSTPVLSEEVLVVVLGWPSAVVLTSLPPLSEGALVVASTSTQSEGELMLVLVVSSTSTSTSPQSEGELVVVTSWCRRRHRSRRESWWWCRRRHRSRKESWWWCRRRGGVGERAAGAAGTAVSSDANIVVSGTALVAEAVVVGCAPSAMMPILLSAAQLLSLKLLS